MHGGTIGIIDHRKEKEMVEHEQRFVWVKDKAGNEYVCRVMDLQDPKKVSEEDLKNCMDDASRAINVGD
jgi:predicted transcriptional regulator